MVYGVFTNNCSLAVGILLILYILLDLCQDSMGKDGTQLLRHCVRLLVLVSTDLLAVRLSGINLLSGFSMHH